MGLIDVRDVKAGYAEADEILRGLTLSVELRDLAVIIGPNGAGKSTALKVIAGQLPIRQGSIAIAGDLIITPSDSSLHPKLAYVPQEGNVFPSLTVRENLEIGGYALQGAVRARVARVLDRFPMLAGRASAQAKALSGGQRQTLALAMALMVEPSMLLLDEPSAGLSPKAAAEMFSVVRGLHASGITIVMVEQNAMAALAVATRGIVLVRGKARVNAPAQAVAAHPDVRKMFLGG
ncbi:MAG: ABC transporter ATP-binding protein [Burkholderiales bacterium]